jgi:TetR/AcrR family tetracycline transcriptional repressor
LGRTQVVETAVVLLDEVGLESLTLRKVATRLGVQAPALYWYVKSKQDLLDQIAVAIAAEPPERPPPAREAWHNRLARHAHEVHELLLRHRDGAMLAAQTGALSRHWPDATAEIEAMVDAGLSEAEATDAVRTVRQFVLGYALGEQAANPPAGPADIVETAAGTEPAGERDDQREPADPTRGDRPGPIEDPGFEAGLRIIIDGLRAHHGGSRRR